MRVDSFDFTLPDDLIAVRPVVPRDAARLLVVHDTGELQHASMRDLPGLLRSGDALVLNDTKVFRARLRGFIVDRGDGRSKVELLLLRRLGPGRFAAFARPARKLSPGTRLLLGASLAAVVERRRDGGEVEVCFGCGGADLDRAIAAVGEMPLPPYIAKHRAADARDAIDYQTVFARHEGSVAAPTAGLHFTADLLGALRARGIVQETVTLHVGAGTFQPVGMEDTADHRMHAERAALLPDVAGRLNAVRAGGGRVVAVGTTALRTLESAASPDGTLNPFDADTDIFILPGYRFKAVDVLLTNFHLPRSTLFMLVSAFCGLETMKAAYAEAIRERYRFYSYGDACLLWRRPP